MKKIDYFLSMFFMAVFVFADIPPIPIYVDVSSPNPQKFSFSVRAGNTPVIKIFCLTNNVAYTGWGAGWTASFNYGLNDSASAMKTIPGTLDYTNGIITFTTLTNSFPAAGNYFAEIYLNNGFSPKLTIGQGQLTVLRSPSSGSIADLNLSPRINFDILTILGTPPWAAGAEPVFFASAAYGITAAQTSNWTTAYTHSQADTVTSNTGNWAGTWGGLTTNALSTTSSVALVTADVTELKGKTSGWDLAKSNGSAATNFIATNTLQAQITANLTNQNATNVLLLASTVSLQSQITANLTNQNATNISLQTQISGMASTNSFVVFQTNQIATNALLLAQITDVRTNQAATNTSFQLQMAGLTSTNLFMTFKTSQIATNALLLAQITNVRTNQTATNSIFQAFITAQANTNALFQYNFGLQSDSNEYFQGLFDTQSSSNALLQTQISTNLILQGLTNAIFESRIGSNETFRITTQPATNLNLQNQITANFTNQNASNAVFLGWHTNQVNSNVIYTSFDARITSNSTWKVGTNDIKYINAITNESLWIAESNNVVYTNTALYLSLFTSTNKLQVQVTANLTNQNATNANLQTQITANKTNQVATNALLLAAINNIDPEGLEKVVFVDGTKSMNYLNVANTNYLGGELITNGTFTGSASNWSLSTFYYQENRVILNPSLTGQIEYTNTLVVATNKLYQLTVKTTYGGAAITGAVGGVSYAWTAVDGETHREYFYAVSDAKLIISASTGTNAVELDDITLKECPTGSLFVAQNVNAGNSVIARVGVYAPNILTISNDLDTAESAITLHTSQIGAISNTANTVTNKLGLSGGIMTGALTNEAGYYGNGVGLTNVTASSTGLAWTAVSGTPTTYGADGYGITNIPTSVTDHTQLTNFNGSSDYLHLTAAEKAIATNEAGMIYRYYARTNANETIQVLASGQGIVVTRTNELFNFSIPVGVHLFSCNGEIDGGETDSGIVRIALGTNDVPQGAISTMWIPGANGWNKTSFANVVIVPRPDPDDLNLIKLSGFGTQAGTVYGFHLIW